jgi:hypothetical protein
VTRPGGATAAPPGPDLAQLAGMTFVSIDAVGREPRPAGGDAVDDLLACHVRIRKFLALARRLSSARHVAADDIAEAAGDVARYFAEALPLHAADEDLSVRPLLERAPVSGEVRALLHRMSAEHVDLHALLADVVPLWREVALRPSLLHRCEGELGRAAVELQARFRSHLEPEESVLFPALRRLPPRALADLRAEMRARRAPPAP